MEPGGIKDVADSADLRETSFLLNALAMQATNGDVKEGESGSRQTSSCAVTPYTRFLRQIPPTC
jgi:hypothetical protein